MDITNIISTYIVPYLPVLATIIGSALSFIKIVNSAKETFNSNKKNINDLNKSFTNLADTLNKVLSENTELKKQNRELKELITHIVEDDNEPERDN